MSPLSASANRNRASVTGRRFVRDDAQDCFLPGTRILTVDGPVAVERLDAGVWLPLMHNGRTAPVWWMGRRVVDCLRHPQPEAVWPVRVAAHAFGRDRPQRDLFLSPDHAVYVDDVLIPISALLNGATVAQVPVPNVTYWHVELPGHGIVLAEGLAVETYLDASNRSAFANGSRVVMLHPNFSRGYCEEAACAPLVSNGPVRDRTDRALLAQAWALGWRSVAAGDGTMRWIVPKGTVLRMPA